MSLHTLSPELIEEIALYLRARDILSLALSSRGFHDIVNGSLLLQYAYRTELAGVYDPLQGLSQCSIVDRMGSLRRWEASWNDLGRYLSAAASPRLVIPAERDLFGPFFLRDDYLFAVDWQGHPTGLRQPALLYVDLRKALCTGEYSWRKIDYPKGSIAITQAFSIEEDDLVVSVLR
jgi:F-box domain